MKYRKKPVVIDAEVYREGLEDGFECCTWDNEEGFISHGECNPTCSGDKSGKCGYKHPYINTLEGKHYITEGDYIITGIKGERYPCKPDIFEMTYEPAE